jgi:glycosyltransferase involved in cell wall biosynthesis
LILDLSRLVYAAWERTPKGIPRVELAYAQHFMASDADRLHVAVLDAFGRLRLVDKPTAEAFVAAIAHYWEHDINSAAAHWRMALRALWIHLVLIARPWGPRTARWGTPGTLPLHYPFAATARPPGAHRDAEKGWRPEARVLRARHPAEPVPRFFTDKDADLYHRRIGNAARLADTIIVNSRATAEAFKSRFGATAGANKVVVAPLGISEPGGRCCRVRDCSTALFRDAGAIEPRKNHRLILDVWQELRRQLGPSLPHLLVIGERGWKSDDVIGQLEENGHFHGHVRECGRMSDAAVAGMLRGARALLLPSLAEGYGLPLAEALACATPVLCSDVPAFREVGSDVPEYLDPTDCRVWRDAILEYARPDSARREAQLARLRTWSRPSWHCHFAVVDAALREL